MNKDLEPFAAMNADPEVMRHFPAPMSVRESAELLDRLRSHLERNGFSWLAVEVRETEEFVGCVGMIHTSFEAAFTPCIELGWRLVERHWGQGLATEAARAVLRWAFGSLHLQDVVAFTHVDNTPSRRVMEKLGMTRDAASDFEHPRLPVGHPLRAHVLYRITRAAFTAGPTTGQ
jgi:RimJ/RimL family protein N-acetyltransferase